LPANPFFGIISISHVPMESEREHMQRFGVSTSARRPRRCLLAAIEALEIRRFMCVFHQDDSGIVEPKPLGPHYDLVNPDEKEIAKLAKAVKSSSLKLSFAPRPMDGPKQQPAAASSLAAAATPARPVVLNGKVAYVSMGHGWTWTGSAWATQRPETNDMVEDFGTQDQGTFYANYLLNAGATVVPMRTAGTSDQRGDRR
jgi:hypothetical protein